MKVSIAAERSPWLCGSGPGGRLDGGGEPCVKEGEDHRGLAGGEHELGWRLCIFSYLSNGRQSPEVLDEESFGPVPGPGIGRGKRRALQCDL